MGMETEQVREARENVKHAPAEKTELVLLKLALRAVDPAVDAASGGIVAARAAGWSDRGIFDAVAQASSNRAFNHLLRTFKVGRHGAFTWRRSTGVENPALRVAAARGVRRGEQPLSSRRCVYRTRCSPARRCKINRASFLSVSIMWPVTHRTRKSNSSSVSTNSWFCSASCMATACAENAR